MVRLFFLFFICCFFSGIKQSASQEVRENYRFTYFGIGFSPLIPGNMIRNNDIIIDRDSIIFKVKQKPGYVFGMEVRHDFTRFMALQTGISFTKRIYDVSAHETDTTITNNLNFIGYEIPLSVLGFVRVSKNFYIDVSAGACMNFYPSDIVVSHFYGRRYRWAQTSLLMNVGVEYRHENIGNFYLGLLYQYHEKNMMTVYYYSDKIYGKADLYAGLSGNFLSANVKYFFPQNPDRLKKTE